MEIIEGVEILSLSSSYLPDKAQKFLDLLLIKTLQRERVEAYKTTIVLVNALPGVVFGNVLETIIEKTNKVHDIALTDRMIADNRRAFERGMESLYERFEIKGIYFSPVGFLGFIFNDNQSVMLQIAEPNCEINEKGGKTIPFFRDHEGVWYGRNYTAPRSYFVGSFAPGKLGCEFTRYLDTKLT